MQSLPDLSSLKNLTELRFSHNKLTIVAPSLANLRTCSNTHITLVTV
jgi:Leucine-rich repeat (LRR) protein